MKFWELVENVLDELYPAPEGFWPLWYVENRHVLRAYLCFGSMLKAEPQLDISHRTIRYRMAEMFPPNKILNLAGNRGRTDIGFLIEYLAQRTPQDMELPPALQASPVWRDGKVRGLALLHEPEKEAEPVQPEPAAGPYDHLEYPCHRDHKFFDWYYNQDCVKMHKSHGLDTSYRHDIHGRAHEADEV